MTRISNRATAARVTGLSSRPALRKKKPYKVIFESVTQEKKKLRSAISYNADPPPGYTFVAAGDPAFTEKCKEYAERDAQKVFVVSLKPSNKAHAQSDKISHHIHRIGHHFPSTIVEKASIYLEYTAGGRNSKKDLDLINSSRLAQSIAKHGKRFGVNQDADRTLSAHHRDEVIGAAIRDLFPKIPDADIHAIVKHAFKEGTNRVGNAPDVPLARRVQLAVCAHARHGYTDYDKLLQQVDWKEARARCEKPCLDQLIKWRGEDETNEAELEEILRETIIIDDSDDDDDDDSDSGLDGSANGQRSRAPSMEIVSNQVAAHELQPEEYLDSELVSTRTLRRDPYRYPLRSHRIVLPARPAIPRHTALAGGDYIQSMQSPVVSHYSQEVRIRPRPAMPVMIPEPPPGPIVTDRDERYGRFAASQPHRETNVPIATLPAPSNARPRLVEINGILYEEIPTHRSPQISQAPRPAVSVQGYTHPRPRDQDMIHRKPSFYYEGPQHRSQPGAFADLTGSAAGPAYARRELSPGPFNEEDRVLPSIEKDEGTNRARQAPSQNHHGRVLSTTTGRRISGNDLASRLMDPLVPAGLNTASAMQQRTVLPMGALRPATSAKRKSWPSPDFLRHQDQGSGVTKRHRQDPWPSLQQGMTDVSLSDTDLRVHNSARIGNAPSLNAQTFDTSNIRQVERVNKADPIDLTSPPQPRGRQWRDAVDLTSPYHKVDERAKRVPITSHTITSYNAGAIWPQGGSERRGPVSEFNEPNPRVAVSRDQQEQLFDKKTGNQQQLPRESLSARRMPDKVHSRDFIQVPSSPSSPRVHQQSGPASPGTLSSLLPRSSARQPIIINSSPVRPQRQSVMTSTIAEKIKRKSTGAGQLGNGAPSGQPKRRAKDSGKYIKRYGLGGTCGQQQKYVISLPVANKTNKTSYQSLDRPVPQPSTEGLAEYY